MIDDTYLDDGDVEMILLAIVLQSLIYALRFQRDVKEMRREMADAQA